MPRFDPIAIGSYAIYTTDHDVVLHAGDEMARADIAAPGTRDKLESYLLSWLDDTPLPEAPASAHPVTLLVDCSGSMRGYPLVRTLPALVRVGDAFSKQGRPFEVLGFTTHSWKGGQSRADWISAGRVPSTPGRLADLCHIVFKDLQEGWEAARLSLALLFKEGMLKENIDGEALVWAANRICARSRHGSALGSLIQISDGAPVDQSTLTANPARFLDDHLDAVRDAIAEKIDFRCVHLDHSRSARPGDIVVETVRRGNAASRDREMILAISRAIMQAAAGRPA